MFKYLKQAGLLLSIVTLASFILLGFTNPALAQITYGVCPNGTISRQLCTPRFSGQCPIGTQCALDFPRERAYICCRGNSEAPPSSPNVCPSGSALELLDGEVISCRAGTTNSCPGGSTCVNNVCCSSPQGGFCPNNNTPELLLNGEVKSCVSGDVNTCSIGFACVDNICCNSSPLEQPPSPPTPPSENMCPSGAMPELLDGEAIGCSSGAVNNCPVGSACINNICCSSPTPERPAVCPNGATSELLDGELCTGQKANSLLKVLLLLRLS
ncbi:MAG: hypothetical protein F6K11_35220 [Leptolyngbya sp. SIO3F4]|nr:hypothetical protein [Leptolyngbya sp. SIO3F4]